MDYTYKIEKKPKSVIEITVTLPLAEIKNRLEEAANQISTNIKFDGFRPGHVPYEMVKKQVGELALYEQAAEKPIQKSYIEILTKEKIEPLGSPQIALEKIAPENDLVYKATVALVPKATLGDYLKVKIKQKPIKIDEAEINKTIDQLKNMRAAEVLENKAAENGDKVEIDFDGFVDNVLIDGGAAKKYPLILGSQSFVEGFEENIIGLKAGEEKEFKVTFPKAYGAKNLAGREAVFKVKVLNVYKRIPPEIDDAFAKSYGFESLAKFRDQLTDNIYHEEQLKRDQADELAIMEKLIEISQFEEIPDMLLDAEGNKMLDELKFNIERQGLKFADYLSHLKKTENQLKLDFIPQAISRVKSILLTRAIFFKENLQVKAEEITSEIERARELYHDNAQALKNLQMPEYRDYLENLIGNRKVIDFLKEHCLEKAPDEHHCTHEHKHT